MDNVLKEFLEEKKKRHLEYLGLYKNCDEKVREMKNEINEIKQPLSDLQRINILLKKCKNSSNNWHGYLEPELEDIIDSFFRDYRYYYDGDLDIENISIENEEEIDAKIAYDYYIINKQKEYIESIVNQLDQIIKDSINKDGIRVKTLKKIYDSLKNYRPIDFDKLSEFRQRLKELNKELNNYYNRNGHWYEEKEPLVLIEISPSDYDELCKKCPPYLMDIEDFVQNIYKNGYDEGYKNGYDEGYDDGYRMGD